MQTFVPIATTDPDWFQPSLLVLDRQRLGKQRIETKQIFNALANGGGWVNHPAVKMWAGYEQALLRYGEACCLVWRERGYQDQQLQWFRERFTRRKFELPPWWGDERVHSSHRANLLRKDPEHYGQFGWTESPVEGYYWPVAA